VKRIKEEGKKRAQLGKKLGAIREPKNGSSFSKTTAGRNTGSTTTERSTIFTKKAREFRQGKKK